MVVPTFVQKSGAEVMLVQRICIYRRAGLASSKHSRFSGAKIGVGSSGINWSFGGGEAC